MKKLSFVLMALFLLGTTQALAVPFLQLDISDGIYDASTQSVVATSSNFTLYALVDRDSNDFVKGSTYYISAAVAPQIKAGANLGSFTWNGASVDVTSDMKYGTAPIDGVAKNVDLPGHGVFPTYFSEFSFGLSDPDTGYTDAYNVQDAPGGISPTTNSSGALYYAAFALDVSGLSSDYALHFDLYTKNSDGTVNKFAPFSHDAQTAPVPEPATLLLLGTGLIGLAGLGRRKIVK